MKKITIHTDGGSRGNPGHAGVGVVFSNEKGDTIKEYSEYLGPDLTNNEAEYKAVIIALKKFKSSFGKAIAKKSEVEIKCDSELLVKQMNGKYKILDEKIQSLFFEIWNAKFDFGKVTFKAVLRDKNKDADRLVNEALDAELGAKKLF